jgi:N-acetyl-anhydromuramyl-L-alanine amidase AmpD
MIHTHGCQYVQAWEFPIRWDTTDSEKAVHFFADEHGIIQALPDNVQGWHAGGAANKTYLGVEISEPYTDTPESFAATLRNVRWLVETMRLKHGFPVSKIVGHCEGHKLGIASNHGDPLSDPGYTKSDKKPWANPAMNGKGYFPRNGYSMDKLRADIAAMSGGGGQPVTPPVEPPPQPADKVLFGVSSKRSIKVRAVQIALNLKGAKISVDGLYGAQTKAAMEAFQRTNEISVTGSFTLATLKKLMPQLSEGKHGELVKVLQQMVGTGADRDFGPLTRKAVEKWQKANRLTVDGVVGPVTWTALLS